MPAPAAREPSPWILRFAPLVPAGAPVLDLAAGGGRHARLFLARGHPVIALDRDVAGLQDLRASAALEIVQADLEDGSPWPLAGRRFGAVVVTNYLWRPLFASIVDSVAIDGVLLYETFAVGNQAYGPPSNPDFLLRPGELLEAARGALQIVAFEHGLLERPRRAVKQRSAHGVPSGRLRSAATGRVGLPSRIRGHPGGRGEAAGASPRGAITSRAPSTPVRPVLPLCDMSIAQIATAPIMIRRPTRSRQLADRSAPRRQWPACRLRARGATARATTTLRAPA